MEGFRFAFDQLLLHVYVDRVRELLNVQFKSEAQSRVLRIDLAAVKSGTWVRVEDSERRRYCEELYGQMVSRPLTYLPVMEYAVKEVLVLQELALQSLPPAAGEAYSHWQEPRETTDLVNASTVLNHIPQAAALRLETFGVFVELDGVPTVTPLRKFSVTLMDHVVCTSGIVIQASRPCLKATAVTVHCKDCGHTKVVKIPMWRAAASLPRQCEGGVAVAAAAGERTCSLDPYVVDSESCQYVDVQKVKLQELPDDVPTGEMPKHVNVNVCGPLVGRATPGHRVLLTGVYTSVDRPGKKDGREAVSVTYVHALGLTKLALGSCRGGEYLPAGIGFSCSDTDEFYRLAQDPQIVQKIVASIAPGIHGLEDIKLSVACMLFGGSRKPLPDGGSIRGDIHVLLLGDPSTAKSQLLKYVSQVAPVSVYTSGKGSSAAGLTAALVRDSHGNFALEGGAMVLADGGVVCIDEFDKMRDEDRVAIHEAMEQQTISIAKAGITCMLATECSVLAAANPTFGTYDDSKDASDQHNFETTILSRFDAIWLVRDQRDENLDRRIAQHVFRLHANHDGQTGHTGAGRDGHVPIPTLLLRKYLSYCRTKCYPALSPTAAKMLENFYVEVRADAKRSTKTRSQIPITVRQLESIVRLSEAFAKMALSPHVEERHVAEAIRLFKMSTVATNSASVANAYQALGPESVAPQDIKNCERALLQRLPLNSRCTSNVIVTDLKLRGFSNQVIGKTLSVLIQKQVLEERADGHMKRIAVGNL
ncbi:putative DNA replication licensing factor MCM5 [Gregarina niphandrodes]|uniref:DNA replication licensing factor MCM5 n=1 Tax=Gregarina niphandrodes TaxID=110365 RepID=A0A023B0T0_GRENI|nr:putative DNA replication licensing factor MCM5 [Gregarina niphandrodes]EZG44854.1 putative DNA replication licensing factor MCM5 [Gregarina niphandrodes]|eukprot:XP_011132638.1 putative DNA replication licensing factor MCM5 [Gregarina niphandrodes]